MALITRWDFCAGFGASAATYRNRPADISTSSMTPSVEKLYNYTFFVSRSCIADGKNPPLTQIKTRVSDAIEFRRCRPNEGARLQPSNLGTGAGSYIDPKDASGVAHVL